MTVNAGICPIETLYRGHRFRSRLEAKWAAFFDAAGWRWQYEPLDLDGWIPDFVIFGGAMPFFVDVKSILERDPEIEAKIDRALGRARTHALTENADEHADPTARSALMLAACPLEENGLFSSEWFLGWISTKSTFWDWDQALFVGPPRGISFDEQTWDDVLADRSFGGGENHCPVDPSPYWAEATNAVQRKPRLGADK
jgi:hypothetical protein